MRVITFGKPLPDRPVVSTEPDWKQSNPRWIAQALRHALARPGGGWFVVDASRRFTDQPRRYTVAGHDLVFWRAGGQLTAAPDACPHMGASLAEGCVREGRLICPWHGLALGREPHGAWRPLPLVDDGVLVWVRVDAAGETPADAAGHHHAPGAVHRCHGAHGGSLRAGGRHRQPARSLAWRAFSPAFLPPPAGAWSNATTRSPCGLPSA